MANVTIDILSRYMGTKGFKLAKKDLNYFEKQVKSVGKSLASVFAVQQVYSFGKSAAKAFMEDNKAATLLAKTLDNLSLGYAKQDVENYIQNLEKTAAVADDYLRPALQRLLNTTNSITKAEGLLSTALNVSAGTGKDLETVTSALSKAYLGNRTALGKLGVPLTKAQLQTMSLLEIQKELNKVYKGDAAAAADTYQGKIDALKIAVDNFKESIGKGLFDALTSAGGEQGFKQTTSALDSLANTLNKVIEPFGIFLGQAKMYLTGSSYSQVQAFKNSRLNELMRSRQQYGGAAAEKYKLEAQKAAEKRAAAIAAKQLAAQKALLKKQQDALKLKKLGYIMDMDQIQIIAALQKATDEETRKRLELQLALMQGNTDSAKKLAQELADIQGKNSILADFLRNLPDAKNPFESWDDYLAKLESKTLATAQKIADAFANASRQAASIGTGQAPVPFIGPVIPGTNAPQIPSFTEPLPSGTKLWDMNTGQEVTVNLNVKTDSSATVDVTQAYTANGGRVGVNRLTNYWDL